MWAVALSVLHELVSRLVFQARVGGGPLQLDTREVLEARYFPVDNLPDGLLPAHREVILDACAHAI